MLAFWVALAVTCAVIVIGILVRMPWGNLWNKPLALIVGAGAVFGAVLGRQMTATITPEQFNNGGDLIVLQNGVLMIGLLLFIMSWVTNGISRI